MESEPLHNVLVPMFIAALLFVVKKNVIKNELVVFTIRFSRLKLVNNVSYHNLRMNSTFTAFTNINFYIYPYI